MDGEIVGISQAMRKVFETIEKVAPSDSAVLICGESGTGKEPVARAIHARSGRANAPFVSTQCVAFAAGVLESKLFGHERGAFTGTHGRWMVFTDRARDSTVRPRINRCSEINDLATTSVFA